MGEAAIRVAAAANLRTGGERSENPCWIREPCAGISGPLAFACADWTPAGAGSIAITSFAHLNGRHVSSCLSETREIAAMSTKRLKLRRLCSVEAKLITWIQTG